MAVEHKMIGTEEEGLVVLQQMKGARKKAAGLPPAPDVGDLLPKPDGLYEVTAVEGGPAAPAPRKTRKARKVKK